VPALETLNPFGTGVQLPSEEGFHLPAGSDPVLKAAPPGLPNALLHPYFKRSDFAVKEVPLIYLSLYIYLSIYLSIYLFI